MELESKHTSLVYEIKYISDGELMIAESTPEALTACIDAIHQQKDFLLSIRIKD